jgi:hypothetical protein
MSLYAIDPLHPDRLRCETCGATVAALPDDGESPPDALTQEQVAHLWPHLAGTVLEHDLFCGRAEGPVYVRVLADPEQG